jgi:hypothetical protein
MLVSDILDRRSNNIEPVEEFEDVERDDRDNGPDDHASGDRQVESRRHAVEVLSVT